MLQRQNRTCITISRARWEHFVKRDDSKMQSGWQQTCQPTIRFYYAQTHRRTHTHTWNSVSMILHFNLYLKYLFITAHI